MQIHTITKTHQGAIKRRIGRGGKRGTYSGRGIKGQHARAGAKFYPAEREILKKIPKLRGYRFKSFRLQPAAVPLALIEKRFHTGDTISPAILLNAGLLSRQRGKTPAVKIIGSGSGKKTFVFKDVSFSQSAREKAGIGR